MHSKLILSAAALLLIASARPAAADPIGPACDTCQGSIYELLYDPVPVGSNATSTIWGITLRIDTTSYSGSGVRIDDVAFKISPNLDGVTLLGAPGGTGAWNSGRGGINASGCDGNASSGFGCATSDSTSVATLPFTGIYEWVFNAFVPSSESLKTDPFDASIKVRYVDGEGDKIGALVSEGITLQVRVIPEPGTALLLAFGLAGLVRAGSSRR